MLQAHDGAADNSGVLPEESAMRRLSLLAVAALILAAGCSGAKSETARQITERERDSVLSRSSLPGAGVVGRAMDAGDREAARAAGLNAQVDSLPR